jgi:hypothetical protein
MALPNTMTNQQFRYWLETMNFTYEKAAELLKTSISTIEGYCFGRFQVSYKHSTECQMLMRLRAKHRLEK